MGQTGRMEVTVNGGLHFSGEYVDCFLYSGHLGDIIEFNKSQFSGSMGDNIMAICYDSFTEMGIDLSPVGVIAGANMVACFCTPKNAEIFGYAGVDGIHYCFVSGFGDMVFTASPMNTPGNYIHPVAKSFEDFLRLLLSCGDAAAIEQAWMWDLPEFETFLQDNQPTQEQEAVLTELTAKTGLRPMEQPWQYIKALQDSFDISKIEFTEDYYDPDMNPNAEPVPPPWEVYFEGNFWGHHGRDKAGTEIPIRREFEFAGRQWMVPAVYSCGKGLVIDICMRVLPEDILAFMKKWGLTVENERERTFTREERMEMDAENPLSLDYGCKAILNGKELSSSHGCGTSYNPCLPEGFANELEAKWVIDHYGLYPSYGWLIWRCSFPWITKKRPNIKSLSLLLHPEPTPIPGPHFRVKAPGDSFSFTHPETGVVHTLAVAEYKRQTMDFSRMSNQDLEYPPNYIVMSYIVSPALSQKKITIGDCSDSDQPRAKSIPTENVYLPKAKAAVVIGIIGGADGPVAFMTGTPSQEKPVFVCSSPHFEPVDDVEWRITFRVNHFEEKTVELV